MGRKDRRRRGGDARRRGPKLKTDEDSRMLISAERVPDEDLDADASKLDHNQGWNDRDHRELVLAYLQTYQRGTTYVSSLTGIFSSLLGVRSATSIDQTVLCQIGSVHLPRLTRHSLEEPFLALPASLTSKQRKMVHECCVECDLFHFTQDTAQSEPSDALGNSSSARQVFLSPYSDGFNSLLTCSKVDAKYGRPSGGVDPTEQRVVPTYKFAPWYLRCTENLRECNRQGLAAIDSLIDQPGNCLRHPEDALDFTALDQQTLAHNQDQNCPDFLLVDSAAKLAQCVQELSTAREVGFDLECFNHSKTAQLTCLLQLVASDTGKEYVIDPLADGVWERMASLKPIFEDASIVKVGHSIGSLDVRCLHRDFGIFVVNAFDTYEGARVLKLPGLGLTAVCAHYGLDVSHHQHLKHDYQTSDWRRRPLSKDAIEYARYDVRFLLPLRKLMIRDLTRYELFDMRVDQRHDEARSARNALEAMAQLEAMYDTSDATFDGKSSCDDETFKTSHQRETFSAQQSLKSVDDADFYTPTSNQSIGSLESDVPGENGTSPGSPWPSEHAAVVLTPSVVASAAELRLQPSLMKVLSLTQERCKSLWGPSKPNNSVQASLLDLWFYKQQARDCWDDSNVQLYLNLAEWRTAVAGRLGCLEEFVVPLEFLVNVAWRKPTSSLALRRLSWDLPDVLLDQELLESQLLDIVREFKAHEELIPSYSDQKVRVKRVKFALSIAVVTSVGVAALAILRRSRRN